MFQNLKAKTEIHIATLEPGNRKSHFPACRYKNDLKVDQHLFPAYKYSKNIEHSFNT